MTSVGTPKAGVFAERAARVVADQLIARDPRPRTPPGYDGTGSCWIELGERRESAAWTWTSSRPPATRPGVFTAPSELTADEKAAFATSRRARWFGMGPGR